jgi:glycerophosphoryl diester phosphodiesterase
MSGLMAAYRRGTAHVLDFDTRMPRDGTPVVLHDPTLRRTTGRCGPWTPATGGRYGCARRRPCRAAGVRSGRRRWRRCWTGSAAGSC